MIQWLEEHLLACPIKSSFGIECFGCGSQRAFIALFKGDIIGSFHYHLALIPFLFTIIALIAQLILKKKTGAKWVMMLFIITCALTLIQYIYKQSLYFGLLT